ncbi:MAG: AmmeMemoRadiSam system protein B [candidate division Zixibacteria bacterium]|nr:AmmeMemoRadiSam system protein B [candidate division Zixibacteria bacterium]
MENFKSSRAISDSGDSRPMSHPLHRKPQSAGILYPAEPSALARTLSEFYSNAKKIPLSRSPLAIVAPHSAYEKSGAVAASAYVQAVGYEYETVVVVAPSHSGFFPGVSVFSGDTYATPLGEIEINKPLVEEITSLNRTVYSSQNGHSGGDYSKEFTIEATLPFLQIGLGKFKLVPIVTGDQEISSARTLGEVLYSCLRRENALIVISTDLSHYHSRSAGATLDNLTRDALRKVDPERLMNLYQAKQVEACGMVGLIGSLICIQRLGVDEALDIEYIQSEVSEREVIGHLSMVFTRSKTMPELRLTTGRDRDSDGFDLNDEDKEFLKNIAMESAFANAQGDKYTVPESSSKKLNGRMGVYVSAFKDGKPVGQSGFIKSRTTLLEATAEAASSALEAHLSESPSPAEELKDQISFRVTLLSSLKRIHDLKKISIKTHGIMVKLEFNQAFSLPNESSGPDESTAKALERICLKAQLPKNSYKDRNAEIYISELIEF